MLGSDVAAPRLFSAVAIARFPLPILIALWTLKVMNDALVALLNFVVASGEGRGYSTLH